ncbi:FMN-binding negative transcriptional regulator [Microtetraspora sp. NBRC 16547]|uniref:FMN-binding negative transcriptional regulator n=1 Tax=Microtetraspora sp. NBRC 16547 TaxID=3030993 RepID=UPI0024A399C1|nr:FMN-binding negative transcriptional regulator [Microtetraspora sp. NBRC 16547]GLW99422.1 transcriptional regulator [Microtetraspora sp. NBRC 16547]
MLEQQIFALDDPDALRGLIRDHGWATLVTVSREGDPVVTHLPVILDPDSLGPAVLGHLARTDPATRGLGERPVVLVVQGPHGYISPSFYEAGPYVPTWNHVTVHLHGTPDLLSPEETYEVLSATVDHFESARPAPFRLADVAGYARRIAPGTTGFRLVPTRVAGKAKLSQDKPAEIVERVIRGLDTDDVHRNPALADAMRAAFS